MKHVEPTARPEAEDMTQSESGSRPKNHEVEHEMICPPKEEGEAPRPKTQPKEDEGDGATGRTE